MIIGNNYHQNIPSKRSLKPSFKGQFEIDKRDYEKLVENIANNNENDTTVLKNTLIKVRDYVKNMLPPTDKVKIGYFYKDNERTDEVTHFLSVIKNNAIVAGYNAVKNSDETAQDIIKHLGK